MSGLVISLSVIFVCLFLHAVFQAYESGLLYSDTNQIDPASPDNGPLKKPHTSDAKRIVSIQSTCVLVAFWTATAISIIVIRELELSFPEIPARPLVAAAAITPLLLVFGQLLPRALFRQRRERLLSREQIPS